VLRHGRATTCSGWWAHLEFTRINIQRIILAKKIEDFARRGRADIDHRFNIPRSERSIR